MKPQDIPGALLKTFMDGCAIPAMPLALNSSRKLDERRQRALTRYYFDSGASGIAVAVHSTQFEIRKPEHALLKPVISIVSDELEKWGAKRGRQLLKVAGVCGRTSQAVKEAESAVGSGYHACLLSLSAMKGSSNDELLAHAREIASAMPVIGFYLQSSVGGMSLPYSFWRGLFEIEGVIGVKAAPFNRYHTIDVARALCESGRDDIALYTGNDDNIVMDLLSEFRFTCGGKPKSVRVKGGLLGHWAVWTSKAVELLEEIRPIASQGLPVPQSLFRKAIEVTDMNAAVFDPANGFAGCIPGIHEVLRRQGLLEGTWCLDPHEVLSKGQSEELDRVCKAYPQLTDDEFVKEHLDEWLSD